jgi:hypothetical protein
MTRTLLVIAALGAIVCILSFSILHAIGGLDRVFDHGRFTADDKALPQVTRDLPWAGSETVHIDNSAAIVTYIQGPTPKFTVTGPRNRVEALTLDGDTLSGANIHWHFSDNHTDEVHITIVSPNTHSFFLSGAETMLLTNYDQDSLDLHLSGAAHIRGVGKAKHLDLEMSGAGDMDMAQLPVDDAKVDISGAGNATIDPRLSADLSISGAGHIGLLTKPATLHSRISGFGAITTPDGSKISRRHRDDKDDD